MISCEKDEKAEEALQVVDFTSSNLAGSWKLTETSISSGGEANWETISNGASFTFQADGTFTTNSIQDCTGENFLLEDDLLILHYDCELSQNEEITEKTVAFNMISFYNRQMILSLPGCIEDCLYKYSRID
ncbi:hypothetical protein DHD80_00455 [Gramella sp. AN32]|nr:hypothetical protein [Gramella sp. AN32]